MTAVSLRRGAAAVVLLVLALCASARASALSPASFDPGPDLYPKIAKKTDVAITMRDGVRLYADVYRPADAAGHVVPGRFPVILNQTSFNKNGALLDGVPIWHQLEDQASAYSPIFVTHGYIQIIVDSRGTGSSEGKWTMFGPEEQRDSVDIAHWIIRQPFSNGRFAGFGASCMAINQIFMGAQRPPGLKALFTIVPMDDLYRDVTWHGGSLDAPFLAVWHGLVGSTRLIPPLYTPADPVTAAQVLVSRVTAGAGPTGDILSRPYDDDYYRVRSPGRVVGQINVPTFVTGGWFDLFQRGAPAIYNALRLPPGRKQLLMGPWYHATVGVGLGEGAPPPINIIALAWFDRWLKGKRNGIEHYGPVTVNQLGLTRRWQSYRSFPRRDVRYRRLYLSGQSSGSAVSVHDGSLTKDIPAPGHDSMPGNGVTGICSRATVQWSAGFSAIIPGQQCELDNRLQEALSLTYTTPRMSTPLHISGPLSLSLRGATTAHDTTWIATVSDVDQSGRSSELTAGWLVQSYRALDHNRTRYARNGDPVVPYHPFTRESLLPVHPGETDAMAIEIFNTDAVIQPGHRLRLTISSGEVPHLLGTPRTLLDSAGGTSTVMTGGATPSHLTIPVAPLDPERRA